MEFLSLSAWSTIMDFALRLRFSVHYSFFWFLLMVFYCKNRLTYLTGKSGES